MAIYKNKKEQWVTRSKADSPAHTICIPIGGMVSNYNYLSNLLKKLLSEVRACGVDNMMVRKYYNGMDLPNLYALEIWEFTIYIYIRF